MTTSNITRPSREFYARDTVDVAKDLLGKIIVRRIGKTVLCGMITETEAYRHEDDPASHAHRGMTERNKAMFGEVGRAYVYFTYGMHYCVNVVARNKYRKAGAVLIRSLEPQSGIKTMMENRGIHNIENLANGPAKLTCALNITKQHYGEDFVTSKSLYIINGIDIKQKIIAGPRIGIRKGTEKMWNFRISA